MGPSNVVEVPDSVAPVEVERPTEAPPAEQPVTSNGAHAVTESSGGRETPAGASPRVPDQTLGLSAWLYRSHVASVLWLGVRLWLGYEWLNAGYQKIWGSEKGAFWFGNGVAVKGFATAGVAGSTSGKGGASYGWWAGFLHNFVVPNASWIGRLISVGELLIGVALILGLLTGAAAFAGLALNVIYMFSGSAGVNPMYAIAALFLVLAWRNAGWFGLDRFVLRSATWTRRRHLAGSGATHQPVATAVT
jgi:thiosulfate dehydrogenase [quinone] large subunit